MKIRGLDVERLFKLADEHDVETADREQFERKIDYLESKLNAFKGHGSKEKCGNDLTSEYGDSINEKTTNKHLNHLIEAGVAETLDELVENLKDETNLQKKVNLVYEKQFQLSQDVTKRLSQVKKNRIKYSGGKLIQKEVILRSLQVVNSIISDIERIARKIEDISNREKMKETGIEIKISDLTEYDRIGRKTAKKIIKKYPVWQMLAKASKWDVKRLGRERTTRFGNICAQIIEDAKDKQTRTKIGGRLKQKLQEKREE